MIIGGGIGGLTAAIALRQQGLKEISVFERSEELREVGAGLTLWPNATWVLDQLGLLSDLVARGTILRGFRLKTCRGETLVETLAPSACETMSLGIHRASLQSVLKDHLAPAQLHLGEKFVRFELRPDGVTAFFASGRTVEGSLLVGADGIHSAVRNQCHGVSHPIYRGYWAWRGISRSPRFPDLDMATESWGRGQRFGFLPIGGGQIYWYATADTPKGNTGQQIEWKDELISRFSSWHKPIPNLIGSTPAEAILKHEICDRPPLRSWGEGAVTLLGDAAHLSTPNLGQGGCMAMEDAHALASCLKGGGNISDNLREYESVRKKRAVFLTREARWVGKIGQWKNPIAVALRTIGIKILPQGLIEHRHRIYFDS